MYCGFCSSHGCEHFAKPSPQVRVLPTAVKRRSFLRRALPDHPPHRWLEDDSVRVYPTVGERPAWAGVLTTADPARGAAIAQERAEAGAAACAGWHGGDGAGGTPHIPYLVAQEPAYLAAWKTGVRKGSSPMQAIASRLTDEGAAVLGASHASLPTPAFGP